MRLTNFEKWFAIRPHHNDNDDHLAGRLTFDLAKGIYLDAVRFYSPQNKEINRDGQTITGWLDYQTPSTIIQPELIEKNGITLSINTPALRESARLRAASLLKNVFLEDINDKIFTGLDVNHHAFHAWANPRLVNTEWKQEKGGTLPSLSVEIKTPQERTFNLKDGTKVSVFSATRIPRGLHTTLEEFTNLQLRFSAPVNFDKITRTAWRISALFEFLIGARTPPTVVKFSTTQKRQYNDEESFLVAEYWCPPLRALPSDPPDPSRVFISEARCPVGLETLLNHFLEESDELIFLADMIQSVEDLDIPPTQAFIELIGCLEAFDKRRYGSGSDKTMRENIKNIDELIKNFGSKLNKSCFSKIKEKINNSTSLIKRLERLQAEWSSDNFRGSPNLKRIVFLRNMMPHGRGHELSSNDLQEMAIFLKYLSALGRYHVLKALGFTGDQIADAFSRGAYRLGMFVPERLIPPRGHI